MSIPSEFNRENMCNVMIYGYIKPELAVERYQPAVFLRAEEIHPGTYYFGRSAVYLAGGSCRCRYAHQPGFDGKTGCLLAGLQVQLFEDIVNVMLDRILRQE